MSGLVGISGAAFAQSSVTLYGVIDTGISYVNHAATANGKSASLTKFDDGVDGGNRWGLKGTEDLGGGLNAVFVLESGFAAGDGTLSQGGALFGRQAYVGLTKRDVGTFTMGRQYVFAHDYLGRFATGGLTAANSYAFHINTLDLLDSSRANNAVKFDSTRFYGLKVGAMYAFSNEAGQFGGNSGDDSPIAGSSRTYSFGADYRLGQFSAAFAYTDVTYPLNAAPAYKLTLANVNPGGQRDLRTYGVGLKYAWGPALLYTLWTNTRLEALDHSASTLNIYEGGVVYSIFAALHAGVGYTRTNLRGAETGTWNQVNTSLDYSLSKSTNVYVLAIYQKASGSNNGVPVQAQIGKSTSYFGSSGSGAQNQIAFRVGIKHEF
jgi:predicted porin